MPPVRAPPPKKTQRKPLGVPTVDPQWIHSELRTTAAAQVTLHSWGWGSGVDPLLEPA